MAVDLSSIKVKVGLSMLGLFLVNVFYVVVSFYFLSQQTDTGTFINVAGRQRMLSQKMTKEAFSYAVTGEKKWQDSLEKTAALFDKSLRAMTDGDKEMLLSATVNADAVQELKNLKELWGRFYENIQKIVRANRPDDPEVKQALTYIIDHNIELLKQANVLTKSYEGMGKKDIVHLQWFIVIMLLIAIILFALCSWILSTQVIKPIVSIVPVVESLAAGDLTARIRTKAAGELAVLVKAFNDMGDKLVDLVGNVQKDAEQVATAATELEQVGTEVSDQASDMEGVAASVAEAADVVNENIQTVSQATQDLNTAATEIAQSVAETARITNEAQYKAQETNEVIRRLGDSSDKIGNIILVINTIAEQTNLLALNATIEAARAGEAGKGFAVVANEVKELAKQTADATQEITQMIQNIQADTGEAVSSVEEITSIVAQVNDLANTIASAAEEQTATVSEISNNVTDAAARVEDVREKGESTKITAIRTVELAQKNLEASNALRSLSNKLSELVMIFKT